MSVHIPVMLDEVLEHLNVKPGEKYIDCTLGAGGYTEAIARAIGKSGQLVSIDLDPKAIAAAQDIKNKYKNIILAHGNFKNISQIIREVSVSQKNNIKTRVSANPAVKDGRASQNEAGNGQYAGIVFDLGLSSDQLQDRDRGFSFNHNDSPLDMNFGLDAREENSISAEEIVNHYPENNIKKILEEFGEERFAYKIAPNIVKERKKGTITTVGQLVAVIKSSVPAGYANGRLHFATKTFQALRIAANGELDNIAQALPAAYRLLRPGGRIVVISFHSLEDRIIKNYFKKLAQRCICPPDAIRCVCGHKPEIKILTKKPLVPGREEIRLNPKSRSAKLRAAEKLI